MSFSDEIDLTISIVSGGDLSTVSTCVRLLMDSLDESVTYEIYLIDNAVGNIEGSLKGSFPHLNFMTNQQMQGFAANHNQVLHKARGRFFLILNDDTVIQTGFCQALISAADANPQAGLLGPRILNPEGTVQLSAYRLPSPVRTLFEMVALPKFFPNHPIVGDYRNWGHDSSREVEVLIGAALLCRRELWEQVGGLDENFYMYAEDADWCFRAHKAGWKVLLVPQAVMSHVGGKSTTGIPLAKQVETLRSMDKFQEKHFGQWGLLLYRSFSLVRHSILWVGAALSGKRRDCERILYMQTVLWALGLLKAEGLQEIAAKTKLPDELNTKPTLY